MKFLGKQTSYFQMKNPCVSSDILKINESIAVSYEYTTCTAESKVKHICSIIFHMDLELKGKPCQLRLGLLCILRCHQGDFATHFGLKCSSLSKMNRGTSFRSPCASLGYYGYPSVSMANMLIERTPSSLYKTYLNS